MDRQHEHVRDVAADDFPRDVVQRSYDVPIVVDFWAPWCGPCKVLGPLLEKVTAEGGGTFELAKVNVDENQQLAEQFRVQGIPTVVAFRDGVPVSRFSGAVPEPALREWLSSILPSELDKRVDAARTAVIEGDTAEAERLFRSVLDEVPDHLEAATGLASMLIARGDHDEAVLLLGKLPPSGEVERLLAAARVKASQGRDISDLTTRLEQDPGQDRIRLELAQALAARGEYEPALDHMLKVVREKGELKDEARRSMLDVFELLGPDHALTATYRRQLASALF